MWGEGECVVQHALVHQLHLAHVLVRVGHEAEAVTNKQQETWVEMGVIDRAGGATITPP